MDEYISRETALKKLQMQLLDLEADQDKGEYSELCENRGARDALDEAIYDIRTLKAADVQLVKRGKWKQIAPQSAICSECGGALKSNGIDKTGKAYIFNAVYKYCPYCGARMDGNAE
jgi:hypothetical protein